MITLTNIAKASLASLLQRKNADSNTGLRISVQKGGCAGLQYSMGVAEKEEGDIVFGDAEARIFVEVKAVEFLEGMTLDYSISLSDSGFKIINPNAARACGCGTSFEPKKKGNETELDQGEACESEQAVSS